MNLKLLLIILSGFMLIPFSFSDTNGIWTYAEDIVGGEFGADETVSNFTFNDIVYFNQDLVYKSTIIEDLFINRSGDSMIGNLEMNNNNINNIEVITGNRVELDGISYIRRVVSDRYFSTGSTAYYLNPAGTSVINNLEVVNGLDVSGGLDMQGGGISDTVVIYGREGTMMNSYDEWLRINGDGTHSNGVYFGNSTVRTDGKIQVGGSGIEATQYCDFNGSNCFNASEVGTGGISQAYADNRYVNEAGDTMSGNLNMNDNILEIEDANGGVHNFEQARDGTSGIVLRTTSNQNEIFQVRSAGGAVRFAVHHGAPNLEGTSEGWTTIGDIRADAFIYNSDRRLKENFENISAQEIQSIIEALEPIRYNFKNVTEKEIGFIAQDVKKILPELVHEKDNGYVGIDYVRLTPILLRGIQSQQEQIDEIDKRLQKIEKKLE